MNKETIKVFEGFAGYGGASFGLKQSGLKYKVVGMSEFDKFASDLLAQNFPGIKNWGDITKIEGEELPDFDMFTGGFPCQPFSTAGLQPAPAITSPSRTNTSKTVSSTETLSYSANTRSTSYSSSPRTAPTKTTGHHLSVTQSAKTCSSSSPTPTPSSKSSRWTSRSPHRTGISSTSHS